MAESVRAPLHFPCAARVKMPQLGSEDSDFSIARSKVDQSSIFGFQRAVSFDLSEKNGCPVGQTYVKDISGGLSFAEDVVRDRCFHMLPYDDKYFWEAVDASQLIEIPQKKNIIVGRHNASGVDNRHMPCMSAKPKLLKPLKKKAVNKALKMHEEAKKQKSGSRLFSTEEEVEEEDDEDEIVETGVFITEIDAQEISTKTKSRKKSKEKRQSSGKEIESEKKSVKEKSEMKKESQSDMDVESDVKDEKAQNDWSAYLMSIISPMTANWIVHQKMTGVAGGTGALGKEDLGQLLETWYGKPDHTDLIRDDMSETEFQVKKDGKEKQLKKWKKEETLLLEKGVQAKQMLQGQGKDEGDKTPFYRQPVGLRKQIKNVEKEELGASNSTARNIQVKSYVPPPLPTMKDLFNENAGKTLMETDNIFEREWLTGVEQIYQGREEKEKIVMTSDNKYQKQLRKEYPGSLDTWYPETEETKADKSQKYSRPTKGAQRWKALPEPLDDTSGKFRCLPPGTVPQVVVPSDVAIKKITKKNPALSQIIDEWRSKWQLSGQFVDSNPEDLLRDMADIQPHVRLKAIATVAKAAEYRPPEEDGLHLEYQDPSKPTINKLPDFIFQGLNCLLEDKHDQVKKAAAVTLYALDKPSDRAEEIVRELLFSESMADRWAAAQCLAHFGVCDSDVAGEVISQLLATEDSIKHEQCIHLLGKLSVSTTLIHSMVGEQLNSSSWRHRVIACKIFPTLDGNINKDITNKLSYLMWKDWHIEVRKSAAQTLGKTGHGRDVHDELKDKILGDDERLKLEAISRIGHLGIMTAKLLPAILQCFDDPYVSVRMEVCITCGNLLLKDELVVNKILYLATFDTSWKVKALAIQALGKIGEVNKRITDSLLWALRFEEEAGVRAEACHSLMLLGYGEDDFIEILQERLLVEDSKIVREEMSSALKQMGFSSNEEIDTVAQIKCEVRKLCEQNIIASQIINNDRDEEKERTLGRMIYKAQTEVDPCSATKDGQTRTSSSHSTKFSTPFQSRAGTNLTLRGDTELEIILNEPDLESLPSAPQTPQTPVKKSQIGSSRASDGGDEQESEVEGPRHLISEGSVQSRMNRIPEESSEIDIQTYTDLRSEFDLNSQFDSQFDSKSEMDDSKSNVTSEVNLPARANKLSTNSDSYITDYQSSLGDTERKSENDGKVTSLKIDRLDYKSATPSYGELRTGELRTSALSMGRSSDRRALLSRETLREREKINAEARKNLMMLNVRYSSMIEGLREIDQGFSANQSSQTVEQEKVAMEITTNSS